MKALEFLWKSTFIASLIFLLFYTVIVSSTFEDLIINTMLIFGIFFSMILLIILIDHKDWGLRTITNRRFKNGR